MTLTKMHIAVTSGNTIYSPTDRGPDEDGMLQCSSIPLEYSVHSCFSSACMFCCLGFIQSFVRIYTRDHLEIWIIESLQA